MSEHATVDQLVDLEVKLAYQDRLIRDLDSLVRVFATRLEAVEHELGVVKRSLGSPGKPVGPQNDPPPHY